MSEVRFGFFSDVSRVYLKFVSSVSQVSLVFLSASQKCFSRCV